MSINFTIGRPTRWLKLHVKRDVRRRTNCRLRSIILLYSPEYQYFFFMLDKNETAVGSNPTLLLIGGGQARRSTCDPPRTYTYV